MDFYPLLFIKRAIAAMVLPPAGPILLAMFGFLLAHRFPRLGRKVFWLGIFTFFVMATPFMGSLLLSHLENIRPPDAAAIKRAQAIVILGEAPIMVRPSMAATRWARQPCSGCATAPAWPGRPVCRCW